MIMIDNVQLESLAQILSKGQASGEMGQNSGGVLYMKKGAGTWNPIYIYTYIYIYIHIHIYIYIYVLYRQCSI